MKTTETIKVLVVDDHRLFSDGLRALLTTFSHIEVTGQVFNSMLAAEQVSKHRPDVMLVDFNMPRLNGLELSKQLIQLNPDIKILIVSMYNEKRHIDEFKEIGVKGYLLKTIDGNELVKAIESVFNGNTCFSHPENSVTGNNHSEDYFLKTFKLTYRELDVLRLIKQGIETQEIADKLHISRLTVETHRKNMCTKLHLRGRNELLKFALEIDI